MKNEVGEKTRVKGAALTAAASDGQGQVNEQIPESPRMDLAWMCLDVEALMPSKTIRYSFQAGASVVD